MRPLPLGRDDHRRGRQRRGAARAVQRRRPPRGLGVDGLLQHAPRATSPYFKSLADTYAMSDNFHQSIQGGTRRQPHRPRHRRRRLVQRRQGQRDRSAGAATSRIPIRSPARTTGTRRTATRAAPTATAPTTTQPGVVQKSTAYLHAARCEAELREGPLLHPQQLQPRATSATARSTPSTRCTMPPSTTPTIGDELLEHDISWRYYGEDWNALRRRPGRATSPGNEYCNICNPFQYATSIMATTAAVRTHMKDTIDLYTRHQERLAPGLLDRQAERLLDGHPASSKLDLFEGFTKKIIDADQGAARALEGHRHLHHLRRGRRLLGLRLRAAGRLLRRRHAHPDHRRVSACDGRSRLATTTPTTCRS